MSVALKKSRAWCLTTSTTETHQCKGRPGVNIQSQRSSSGCQHHHFLSSSCSRAGVGSVSRRYQQSQRSGNGLYSQRSPTCAAGVWVSCGPWASPSPLPALLEQELLVRAWRGRGLFGSKLMQNTVTALSCELLRRSCKGYAQPRVCLRGERKDCYGKRPHHCSWCCTVRCLYNSAKWQAQTHS